MGDSGWCGGERDFEAEFDSLPLDKRNEIESELLALGCIYVTWDTEQ